MKIARVVGNLISTIKDECFHGYKLMIVEFLNPDGTPDGKRQIAFDAAHAGIGDTVLVNVDGGAANMFTGDKDLIADYTICGVWTVLPLTAGKRWLNMDINEVVKQTTAELERLIGGTAVSPDSLKTGGSVPSAPGNAGAALLSRAPAGTAPAYAVPAYIRPAPEAALPVTFRGTAHGAGVYSSVPGKLEHSLLDPGMTREKIIAECRLAAEYGIGCVVVSPYFVECAAGILRRTGIAVCSAAGFPHGAASGTAKSAELRECIRRGATEMDVAVNILAIKSGEVDAARRELQEMLQIARGKCLIKAIYEQALYTGEEKKTVLSLIRECSCDFVKISNALSGKKAEEADVQFVREIVGGKVGIKIDGGVKTLEKALALFNSGADRIGLTATVAVAKEALGIR